VTLAETQALFHATVTGGDVDPSELERWLAGSERLPAAARVGIYAEMWFWRQVEALRAEFPALAACAGEERFQALCRDYLRAHPSEHHDIGRLGRRLPPFLRLHPAPDRTDLGDLAELEWARSEVFFEAPARPAGREVLAALGPEPFSRARLRFVPAFRLLALDHPVDEVWRAAVRGERAGPASPASVQLAVWRVGHEVFHTVLERDEARALRAARDGASLEATCASFAARDDPAAAAFAALASWFDEGWVAGLQDRPNRPEAGTPAVR